MSFWAWTLLCAAGSYLLGAIPFALWVGRLKGVDVRKVGSGNVGAMNLGRLLGRKWFFLVFALDMLKGLAPSLIAGWLLTHAGAQGGVSPPVQHFGRLGVGLLAVVGHSYSVYIGFRGGKGVSTSLGVALGVYPEFTVPGVGCFFVWAIGLGLTRMSSVGSISGALLFPVLYVVWSQWRGDSLADRWPFLAFSVLIAVLVVARHRANIGRILAGTETRVGRPGGPAASPTESELV